MADVIIPDNENWSEWTFEQALAAVTGDSADLHTPAKAAFFTFSSSPSAANEFNYHAWDKYYFGVDNNTEALTAWNTALSTINGVMPDVSNGRRGTMDLQSLRETATAIQGMSMWAQYTGEDINTWASALNQEGSGFQGSAAFLIQFRLQQNGNGLRDIYEQMTTRHGTAMHLAVRSAGDALANFNASMANAWSGAVDDLTGLPDRYMYEIKVDIRKHLVDSGIVKGEGNYLLDATAGSGGATIEQAKAYIDQVMAAYSRGDLRSASTWSSINQEISTALLNQLKELVDTPGQQSISMLTPAYQRATSALIALTTPTKQTPPSTSTSNSSNSSLDDLNNNNGGSNGGLGDPDGSGGNSSLDDTGSTGGSTGLPDANSSTGDDLNSGSGSTDPNGTTSATSLPDDATGSGSTSLDDLGTSDPANGSTSSLATDPSGTSTSLPDGATGSSGTGLDDPTTGTSDDSLSDADGGLGSSLLATTPTGNTNGSGSTGSSVDVGSDGALSEPGGSDADSLTDDLDGNSTTGSTVDPTGTISATSLPDSALTDDDSGLGTTPATATADGGLGTTDADGNLVADPTSGAGSSVPGTSGTADDLGSDLSAGLGSSDPGTLTDDLGTGLGSTDPGTLTSDLGSGIGSGSPSGSVTDTDLGAGTGGGNPFGTPVTSTATPLGSGSPGSATGTGLTGLPGQTTGSTSLSGTPGAGGATGGSGSSGSSESAGASGIPFSSPMMGGQGAGAQNKPEERERQTWLSEDEKIWGTHLAAGSGVIGRPDDDEFAEEEGFVPSRVSRFQRPNRPRRPAPDQAPAPASTSTAGSEG